MKHGMIFGFSLVTLLGVIHYNYGNDYMSYYDLYNTVIQQPFDIKAIMSKMIYREPGWVILNYAFSYVGGFFMLVAVLNIIQNLIIFHFIKDEVEKTWWPMSVFLYLFVYSFYLMGFTMMRQWFVACVFLGVWSYIKQKKWILPLLILYLCSFIHSSAIILLPFVFIGYLPIKNTRFIAVAFATFLILLWIGGSWIDEFIGSAAGTASVDEYLNTYGDQDRSPANRSFGFILHLIPLVVGLWYFFKNNKNENIDSKNILVLISLIGFVINPMTDYVPMVGRLETYFSIFQIASVPVMYGSIRNNGWRGFLLFCIVLVITYEYILFFELWKRGFATFHTIFEVL